MIEQRPHSRHLKKKCNGCGGTFTRKELDEHILGIIRSLRV